MRAQIQMDKVAKRFFGLGLTGHVITTIVPGRRRVESVRDDRQRARLCSSKASFCNESCVDSFNLGLVDAVEY